jgi:hypothetical protein
MDAGEHDAAPGAAEGSDAQSDPAAETWPADARGARAIGVGRLVVGFGAAALLYGLAAWARERGYRFGGSRKVERIVGVAFVLPLPWALLGALEMVAGVPYRRLSAAWAELPGWRKAGVGLLAVVGCLLLFVGIAWIVLRSRT